MECTHPVVQQVGSITLDGLSHAWDCIHAGQLSQLLIPVVVSANDRFPSSGAGRACQHNLKAHA